MRNDNPQFQDLAAARLLSETNRRRVPRGSRIYVDKGCADHHYPSKRSVYKSSQKRGLTLTIKKELRRRSAIEAVIGHMKTDGRLGRHFLKGRDGERINDISAGAGYNYRLVSNWLMLLLARIMAAIFNAMHLPPTDAFARAA